MKLNLIFALLFIIFSVSFAFALSLTDFLKISGLPITSKAIAACSGTQISSSCCPDLNADGMINATDLQIIKKAYGSKIKDSKYNLQADINADGKINSIDLNLIKSSYGRRITGFFSFVNTLFQKVTSLTD